MTARRDPRTGKDDLAFMQSPDDWPNWPILPIKRYVNGNLEVAVLVHYTIGLVNRSVYRVAFNQNMWALPQAMKDNKVEWAPADPRMLVADGWEVD